MEGKPAGDRCVAIMQPYFYPYPAYFALLAAADTFVIYDCVQFPRRGRVHRSEIARDGGTSEWLTLPLLRQSRNTIIENLLFGLHATETFHRRLTQSARLNSLIKSLPTSVTEHLFSELTNVVDYLERGLRIVGRHLGFEPAILRSSALAIDPGLRGQERVIAIASFIGAKRYVNTAGGRSLYDPVAFEARGIRLEFLPHYIGQWGQGLPALASATADELRTDVLAIAAGRSA